MYNCGDIGRRTIDIHILQILIPVTCSLDAVVFQIEDAQLASNLALWIFQLLGVGGHSHP